MTGLLLLRQPAGRVAALADGCVATIGAFDGLHLGHRRIIGRVLDVAKKNELPALVLSFDPTPKEFFMRDRPPARLMRFREKYQALEGGGCRRIFLSPLHRPR